MKLPKFCPRVILTAFALVSALPGLAQENAAGSIPSNRLTITPNELSVISMKTLPQSVCTLHAEGDSDTTHAFKLFADDEGTIIFRVSPSVESEQVARFAVDCTANGKSVTLPLELRPSFAPTSDMPTPTVIARAPRASDVIRPALSKEEAAKLSTKELMRKGYPVRPDATQDPEAYAMWLEVVSKPARYVNPKQIAHPDVRHVKPVQNSNLENLSNWSGFELRGANNTYSLVNGVWNVPVVFPETNNTVYSSFWVGLDGDGTTDLWQAGTAQQIQNIDILGIQFNFSSYYAWSELLPLQPSEAVISNISVSPGDQMWVQVWVNSGLIPTGEAIVQDISKGEFTVINAPPFPFEGSEAEWIMERPTVNGSLPGLADYVTAFMNNAEAMQPNGTWVDYNGANNQQIFMFNGRDELSAAFPWTSTSIQFFWLNFQ